MIRLWGGVIVALALLVLQACTVEPPKQIQPPVVQTPAQRHAQAAANISGDLQRLGVQVVRAGETMILLLPSDQLFIAHSSNFDQAYADQILPLVAQLLRALEAPAVEIIGYTDNRGASAHHAAVSERQAQRVLNYLWSDGVDVRIMYAKGAGRRSPIATNKEASGCAANRRIAVKFRYVPLAISQWSR